ncbi:MAG TPA: YitT family protein [Dictyoglomaceae bacterium]|nr:YitT family protein [Dictyoglomaceae bacterium]HOL39636.1 YitT family protein [Dictyoglomaceae bacterium]HOP95142.1 YitT family protein [Dictyoglomaceae bacterium]HPP15208.1 YitT family protein [Dictyoglomaceae bacterium]HPU42614.1 YitT family protein [Dictyoglomaceae bacterium]
MKKFIDYLGISFGVLLVALSIDLFLLPNKLVGGGVSGIAIILYYLLKTPVGLMMIFLNIPIFILGVRILGSSFGVKTIFGTLLLSILVDFLNIYHMPVITDPFIATVYGGILSGIGLGIVFKYEGSTGGTDVLAQILSHFSGLNLGQSLLIIDGIIVLIAGFLFDFVLALYALLVIFIQGYAIDLVQEGLSYTKAAIIFSDNPHDLGEKILKELGRGVTVFYGVGLYTGKEREILYCVVSQSEVGRLKEIIHRNDPKSFVVITPAHEVLGEGFKSFKI